MADDKERFLRLGETVMGMMEYLRGLLLDLPIPVVLPELLAGGSPDPEAVLALDRARDLLEAEPIPGQHQTALEHLILNWFIAYEMLVLRTMAGPAAWRLDAAEHAIRSFTTIAEMIESGELEDDES
ncbi:hypothetical protein ABZZ79_03295 [Streptomyces sp. NPDC006458]|uniref:hypothetical protein n=1 Tax=Streptomyces sp. NPDC006458 TaxID=3154302 RepID=UPI0033A619C1